MCSMQGRGGGGSCGREEVPGMCIAIVSGVLPSAPQRLFGEAVCFDPINHNNTVAKQNRSRGKEDPRLPASGAHGP